MARLAGTASRATALGLIALSYRTMALHLTAALNRAAALDRAATLDRAAALDRAVTSNRVVVLDRAAMLDQLLITTLRRRWALTAITVKGVKAMSKTFA